MQADTLRSEGWEITCNERLGDERLPVTLETALYRIAQEALTNVRKHADTTRVNLSLALEEQEIQLQVGADGPGEQVGLSGMEERVALIGGERG